MPIFLLLSLVLISEAHENIEGSLFMSTYYDGENEADIIENGVIKNN